MLTLFSLSQDPTERLMQLFDELYGPECERHWIHYAVHLLTALSQCVVPRRPQRICLLHLLRPRRLKTVWYTG